MTQQYQNRLARLITITGYHLEKNLIFGVCNEKTCAVYIAEEEYNKKEQLIKNAPIKPINKWMGHNINEQMKIGIPIGSKVILQGCITVAESDDNYVFEALSIIKIRNEPDANLKGIFELHAPSLPSTQKITKIVDHNSTNKPKIR